MAQNVLGLYRLDKCERGLGVRHFTLDLNDLNACVGVPRGNRPDHGLRGAFEPNPFFWMGVQTSIRCKVGKQVLSRHPDMGERARVLCSAMSHNCRYQHGEV